MSCPIDHERLLADALADEAPAGFREALLDSTLRLARRRRRIRQVRQGVVVLAMLGLAAIFFWRNLPQRPAGMLSAAARCGTIRTQPLPASALVATKPFPPDRLIVSVTTAEVVQTTPLSGGFRVLNDDQLLTLVAPRPAALVRRGPQLEELVFVNPGDEKGFPVN
jgi:hypothetical protein